MMGLADVLDFTPINMHSCLLVLIELKTKHTHHLVATYVILIISICNQSCLGLLEMKAFLSHAS